MLKIVRFLHWIVYIISLGILIIHFVTLDYRNVVFVFFVLSLLLGVISYFAAGIKKKKFGEEETNFTCGINNRSFGGRCLLVINMILLSLIGIMMITLLVYGGGPDIIDGVYCITNHNDFVRTITVEEYNILCRLEETGFASCPALMNALFLGTHLRKEK